jgi:hypothetical protein
MIRFLIQETKEMSLFFLKKKRKEKKRKEQRNHRRPAFTIQELDQSK